MSTRWYPIYQRGNPQLRVFLPNFWMKLVKLHAVRSPPNVVHFKVSPEMTRLDVKNYLEKMYNVPVMNVKTMNQSGFTHENVYKIGELDFYKDDDVKFAAVTLPKGYEFRFPEVTKNPDGKASEEDKVKEEIEQSKNEFRKVSLGGTKGRRGLPNFFGL